MSDESVLTRSSHHTTQLIILRTYLHKESSTSDCWYIVHTPLNRYSKLAVICDTYGHQAAIPLFKIIINFFPGYDLHN